MSFFFKQIMTIPIYISIYLYWPSQTDSFVVSQDFSVARYVRRLSWDRPPHRAFFIISLNAKIFWYIFICTLSDTGELNEKNLCIYAYAAAGNLALKSSIHLVESVYIVIPWCNGYHIGNRHSDTSSNP